MSAFKWPKGLDQPEPQKWEDGKSKAEQEKSEEKAEQKAAPKAPAK